jgi:hypothetical protein
MSKYTYTNPITTNSDSTFSFADDSISITLDNTMADQITLSSAGASGSILTSGNTSPYNYNYNWVTTSTGTDTITLGDYFNNLNNTLQVQGDANFEGDVKIKGKSLVESLEKIEEKLAILHPNIELEEKWEQLRELRRQYMELEKDIIEKEKVWDILKK